MSRPLVLVVGETDSLAQSIVDVLDAAGIASRLAPTIAGPTEERERLPDVPVVIAASATHVCATARRWLDGERMGSALVVVGTRDPVALRSREIHCVHLPLDPPQFVDMIRSLTDAHKSRGVPPFPVPSDRAPRS